MSNQDMITAIITAIQDNAKLMLVMRIGIMNNIGNLDTVHLQALCAALGIDTSGGGGT